jgi:hypothetical protein
MIGSVCARIWKEAAVRYLKVLPCSYTNVDEAVNVPDFKVRIQTGCLWNTRQSLERCAHVVGANRQKLFTRDARDILLRATDSSYLDLFLVISEINVYYRAFNLCIFIVMSMYSLLYVYVSPSCQLALFGYPD